jgi:hypothetical protein
MGGSCRGTGNDSWRWPPHMCPQVPIHSGNVSAGANSDPELHRAHAGAWLARALHGLRQEPAQIILDVFHYFHIISIKR